MPVASTYRSGSLGVGRTAITTKTAAYTADVSDEVILVNAASGAVTITLPAVTNTNKAFIIKKIDSTLNQVTIDTPGSETIDGLAQCFLTKQYETVHIGSDGTNWHCLNLDRTQPRLLTRVEVALTATAVTTLIVVPTSQSLHVTDTQVQGSVLQSGGTASTLKVGTSGGSYAELLNSSTGLVQTTATATTLVGLGDRFSVNDRFTLAGNSAAYTRVFAAGSTISAQVTGAALPSTGKVFVETYGFLL